MRVRRSQRPIGVMRGSVELLRSGPFFSASVYMLRNFTIWKGLPFFPTRSWRKNTGPGELTLTSRAITSISGLSSISARMLTAISMMRFRENCQAGMISGFTSIRGAPKMLDIFTEPARMSYMSGMILMRTPVPSSSFMIRLMWSCSLLSTATIASST